MNKLSFWAIFLIPVLWGLSYPLTRNAVMHIDPGVFAFARQLIAAICLLPCLFAIANKINRQVILGACLIAICNVVCTVAISYALTTLNSALTAFFVTLNIIFVPFLAMLFGLSRIKVADIITVVIGLGGIFVTFHGTAFIVASGDLLGLVAAVAFAMQLVIMQVFTRSNNNNQKNKNNALALALCSTVFSVVLLSYFPLHRGIDYHLFLVPAVCIGTLYQGLLSTALALILQLYFANDVGATRTAIILNLDLVFASLFGLLNGESISRWQLGGILLALLATICHDVLTTT